MCSEIRNLSTKLGNFTVEFFKLNFSESYSFYEVLQTRFSKRDFILLTDKAPKFKFGLYTVLNSSNRH